MTADDLSQFEQEDRIPSGNALVSLHDVIERGVSVHWDEAVAIVEEFCEVAMAGSGETAPVPDLENILIGSDGHVELRRTRGDKSPTAAGRMLHALLSNGDVPMPLRLFVTQSTAQDTHRSLREFARGLAYFGKPARRQLIKDVYARCVQRGRQAAGAPPVPPPPLPNSVAEQAKASDRPQKSKRKSIKKWLLVAATLVLVGSAAWLLRSGGAAKDVQGSATRVLSEAAGVLAELGQQVRNTLSSTTAAPTTAAVEPKGNAGRSRSRRRASSADTSPVEPKPLVSRRVSLPKSAGGWQLAAAVPNKVDFEPAAVYQQPTELEPEQSVLYSSSDSNVEPPVLLFPQLTPPLAPAGSSSPALNRMVVVVSAEGDVERVQLIEGPARMPDMMLLSGAKTWRFTPAFKDGEPVRYRTVISWAALP
jgi:hypothetical protein